MTQEDTASQQIILAAISAAGPVDGFTPTDDCRTWEDRVRGLAFDIFMMAHPSSQLSRQLGDLSRCRPYLAVVESVKKEQTSKRGLVKLRVKPSKFARDGVEIIRTDFMDVYGEGDAGVNKGPGHAMAVRARDLIGHQVTVWAETERNEDGTPRGKVLRHLEDRGPAGESVPAGGHPESDAA